MPLDPRSLMDPEMAAAVEKMAEIDAGLPSMPAEPSPEELRERMIAEKSFWNEDPPSVYSVEDISVAGPSRDVPVRVYRPVAQGALPAIVYFHGGGWVKGTPETHDRMTRIMALESGAAVFSVDYALAPEHRFPTALDESAAVVEALADDPSRWGLDGTPPALSGDSAGANLALAAAIELRERRPGAVGALALFYGVYDSDFETPSYRAFGGGDYGLSRSEMIDFWDMYMGPDGDRHDPRAALVNADLAGLPPAYMCAAGLDVLRDDTLKMVERLQAAGVRLEFHRFEGFRHGFAHLGRLSPKADGAIAAAARFIRSAAGR